MSAHIQCTDAYKTHIRTHTSARQTLRSPVLIGNELSVGDEDVCERSGPAQKPLCMKPWNAHMEHVIE